MSASFRPSSSHVAIGESTGRLDRRGSRQHFYTATSGIGGQSPGDDRTMLTWSWCALLGWIMLSVIGPIYDVISKSGREGRFLYLTPIAVSLRWQQGRLCRRTTSTTTKPLAALHGLLAAHRQDRFALLANVAEEDTPTKRFPLRGNGPAVAVAADRPALPGHHAGHPHLARL
jgi:hypothetical protein